MKGNVCSQASSMASLETFVAQSYCWRTMFRKCKDEIKLFSELVVVCRLFLFECCPFGSLCGYQYRPQVG